MTLRALGGELRWLLDATDPLAVHNRRLALCFLRRDPGTVVRQARIIPTHGHTLKAQAIFVHRLMVRNPWITDVLEIGFNAGHSSHLFLSSRPDVRVVSFDICGESYVDMAKEIIDARYPRRHRLIVGDSRQTIPEYADAHPGVQFDLIFVDGGHDYDTASADLANCERVSGPRTLVLMDDVEPSHEWGEGPAAAWRDAVSRASIEPVLLVENGFPLFEPDITGIRDHSVAWALGRYTDPGRATHPPRPAATG